MSKATQIIIAFAIVNIALYSWFSGFIAEDAYIVYRYSENLANGNGLVFNPGEYVSALTSPLHSLVVSGLYYLTGESACTNRCFALGLHFFATLYAFRSLLKHQGMMLFGIMIWLSPYAIFWTAGGLETMYLSSFLVLAFAASNHCNQSVSARHQIVFSVCLGLAFLTRFDSCLVTIPLWFQVASRQWNQTDSRKLTGVLRLLLPGLVIALAWLVSAYGYYHDIFPTSVYHKPARWDHQRTNVLYMIQFGLLTGLIPLLCWTVINHYRHEHSNLKRAGQRIMMRHWGLVVGGLLFASYATGTATAHMMFSYRMLLPYLPLLTLASLQMIFDIHPEGLSGGRYGNTGTKLIISLAVLVQAFQFYYIDQHSVNPGRYGEYTNLSRQNYMKFMEILAEQATAIDKHWQQQGLQRPPQVHVYAAGILPYHLEQSKVVDWGLISYRKNVKVNASQKGLLYSSDYIITLTPRHFTQKHQLQQDPQDLELIHEKKLAHFDHADDKLETFSVFFNPYPSEYALPNYVDGPELMPIPDRPAKPDGME